jgi:hypothetical protein
MKFGVVSCAWYDFDQITAVTDASADSALKISSFLPE